MGNKAYRGHVLVIPYPSQGHINPMLQFSKRLSSKGVKATLAITLFISKSIDPEPSSSSVQIDTISDGCDEGGFAQAGTAQTYIKRLETVGSKTLAELILRHKSSHPIDCIVYDASIPWALDVAKQFGLLGAPFFTQTCAVDYIYHNVHHGLLSLPISSTTVSIP